MKKIIISVITLLVILTIFIFTNKLDEDNSTFKKVRVADTTLTSRTKYM